MKQALADKKCVFVPKVDIETYDNSAKCQCTAIWNKKSSYYTLTHF